MRLIGDVYRSIAIATMAAVALLATSDVDAQDSPVVVGEVSTNVVRDGVDVPVLRATVAEELPAIDLSHARKRSVILSVSLVRMDTEATAQGTATTCVISAALRTKKGGDLFAILEGRAQAQEGSDSMTRERNALRHAVRGALERIPEALGQ